MLKIYIQDNGVYGCILVIKESREKAIELMKTFDDDFSSNEIEEFEIKDNFYFVNSGDR